MDQALFFQIYIDGPPGVPGVSKDQNFIFTYKSVQFLADKTYKIGFLGFFSLSFWGFILLCDTFYQKIFLFKLTILCVFYIFKCLKFWWLQKKVWETLLKGGLPYSYSAYYLGLIKNISFCKYRQKEGGLHSWVGLLWSKKTLL